MLIYGELKLQQKDTSPTSSVSLPVSSLSCSAANTFLPQASIASLLSSFASSGSDPLNSQFLGTSTDALNISNLAQFALTHQSDLQQRVQQHASRPGSSASANNNVSSSECSPFGLNTANNLTGHQSQITLTAGGLNGSTISAVNPNASFLTTTNNNNAISPVSFLDYFEGYVTAKVLEI